MNILYLLFFCFYRRHAIWPAELVTMGRHTKRVDGSPCELLVTQMLYTRLVMYFGLRPSSPPIMQKIIPFLWFDGNAEEARNLYVSIFRNSKIGNVSRCGADGAGPEGTVMTASFTLEGQEFMALIGGPSRPRRGR